MNIVAASLVAQRHERQITPIALALYAIPLCINLLAAQAGERPATLGYFLLGVGLALLVRALPLCGLSRYGRRFLLKGLGTALLGGLLWWMAMYSGEATGAAWTAGIAVYGLAGGVYRMFRKRDTVFGMTIKEYGADFFERFAAHLKASGGVMEQLPIRNWPYRCKYKSARCLMKPLNAETIAFSQISRRGRASLKKLVDTFPGGVDKVRFGCSVHPGITESFMAAQAVFLSPGAVVKDAYIIDNTLCFVFADQDRPGDDRFVTAAFGPLPRWDRPFLEIFQVCAEDVFKAKMQWDIPERTPLPQFVGARIDYEVVHQGPLDRFGEKLILRCAQEGRSRQYEIAFADGKIRIAETDIPTVRGLVPVGKYLDFWGGYSPAYATMFDDTHDKVYDRSTKRMAPRDGYALTAIDTFDRSRRIRIREYRSEYEAIRKAMERAEKEAPRDEIEQSYVYQVHDHNGKMRFSSNCPPPFEAGRHILVERLAEGRPFWGKVVRNELLLLLMFIGLVSLTCIPFLLLLAQDNGYALLFSFLIYYSFGGLVGCCNGISLEANSRWGRFASFLLFLSLSGACIVLLLCSYAFFLKG